MSYRTRLFGVFRRRIEGGRACRPRTGPMESGLISSCIRCLAVRLRSSFSDGEKNLPRSLQLALDGDIVIVHSMVVFTGDDSPMAKLRLSVIGGADRGLRTLPACRFNVDPAKCEGLSPVQWAAPKPSHLGSFSPSPIPDGLNHLREASP